MHRAVKQEMGTAAGGPGVTRARNGRPGRPALATLVTSGLLAVAGTVGFQPAAASATTTAPVAVIVRAGPGATAAAERAVVGLGGHVGQPIAIINGFAATLDAVRIGALRAAPSVTSVSPDTGVALLGSSYDPTQDPHSLLNIEGQIGTRSEWVSAPAGAGAGVDVALIDSGVTPVPGLDGGQVVQGPDLTDESHHRVAHLDTFGHGTFIAGIIAGHDAGADPATAPPDAYLGVAPASRIISVKVADQRGNTDLGRVLAGIDWAVRHAHDPGMDIRVINLSFGITAGPSYQVDPLAFAAEAAWHQGIVVVASAGNAGGSAGRLTDPAIDPFLIAVGSADVGSAGAPSISPFSSQGGADRFPDVVAPGAHVQGLRDPGSFIDRMFSSTGAIDARYFRGSGTSEAAAYVSGTVAQLLSARPDLTPDQVKWLLVTTAHPLGGAAPDIQGAGLIDVLAASSTPASDVHQGFPVATGPGRDRGDEDGHGGRGSGRSDGSTWSGDDWDGSTWSGSTWSGSTWSSSWSGSTWSGSTWSGSTWS